MNHLSVVLSLCSFVRRYGVLFLLVLPGFLLHAQTINSSPPAAAFPSPAANAKPLIIPVGTKVTMAVMRAVWAAKVKAGDPLYLETVFPVTAGNRIAIPAGTYVSATIDAAEQPTRKVNQAELEVHFNQIVFAGGYAVTLAGADGDGVGPPLSSAPPGGARTSSLVTIQVSQSNDLLLDNGSQIEMTIEEPLSLDAGRIARAVALSRAPAPGSFKPGTLCRPTPGDPGSPGTTGTPDTVIPGSPPGPDTTIVNPDGSITTIPGSPGTPDTIIPGIPGTTGTPGTPGTYCPAPPLVISSTPGGTPVAAKQPTTTTTKKTRLQDRKQGQ